MGGMADIYMGCSIQAAEGCLSQKKTRPKLKASGRRDGSANHFTRKVTKTGDSEVTCLAWVVLALRGRLIQRSGMSVATHGQSGEGCVTKGARGLVVNVMNNFESAQRVSEVHVGFCKRNHDKRPLEKPVDDQ